MTHPPVTLHADTRSPWGEPEKMNFTFLIVWLFVFEAFVRLEDIFPIIGSLHPVFVLGIGGTLAFAISVIRGRGRFQYSTELGMVLSLTVWFILGIPFAYWRGGSLHLLITDWSRTLLFFFLLTQVLTSVARIRKILWAVVLSELVVSVASLIGRGNLAYEVGERFAGVNKGLLGWNFLGITLSVTLPFVAYLYVSRRSLVRTCFLLAVLGCTGWMLVLTASRGGVFGIAFSGVLSWWFILRGTPRSRLSIIVLALCLLVSVAKAPDVFWERLSVWNGSDSQWNSTAASAAESAQGREKLLKESILDTLHNPVFGLGIGNFAVYHGNNEGSTGSYGTHNTFTQISSEGGLPALLLIVLLVGVVISHMKRVSSDPTNNAIDVELRLLARATLVSTLAFVFSGFFAHIAYDYLLYYIVGIEIGVWTIARGSFAASRAEVKSSERFHGPLWTRRVHQWR